MFMVDTFGRGSAPYPQVLSVPVTMQASVSFVRPPDVMRKCGTVGALRNKPLAEGLVLHLSFWRKCLDIWDLVWMKLQLLSQYALSSRS